MKRPLPPPQGSLLTLIARHALTEDEVRSALTYSDPLFESAYHPWDYFAYHEPPKGLSRELWWAAVRTKRLGNARPTPFTLTDGTPLTYNLPDSLLQLNDVITAQARGKVELPTPAANPTNKNRYLLSSLIEEAITTAQLEGASTSRRNARIMLNEQREPTNRSERMIVNSYMAMQRVSALKDEPLTPELVCEFHRMITADTLDNPDAAGRLQQVNEERVRIYGSHDEDQLLHIPPPAQELPERLDALCRFANEYDTVGTYMPPLLRAFTLHFMMGHDHYFEDGNGRTARTVFYWSLLNQGFFLAEYLSISRLLRKAPAQYARAFLHAEQDGGDLTHFFLHQARTVSQAIDDLYRYLEVKSSQFHAATQRMRGLDLNHRQIDVLEGMLRDDRHTTIDTHMQIHQVVYQTARTDLLELEKRGYVRKIKRGNRFLFLPSPDIEQRLDADTAAQPN